MMKIAIISFYLLAADDWGYGYPVHCLASQFVFRGHEVTVFTQSLRPEGAIYEVQVVSCEGSWRAIRFAWKLRRIDLSEFDVLHAHGHDWFLGGVSRPPHIRTYHRSQLSEIAYEPLLNERLRMFRLAVCEWASCAVPDQSVAVAHNLRRFLPSVERVIPNGVNPNVFNKAAKKSRVPSILFVGARLGRTQGDALMRTFQREVREKSPEAKLWMVCDEKVAGPGVLWFGRSCLPLFAQLYRNAWVFCLPSCYEGCGVRYLKAMAAGSAIVATPNVGACEAKGAEDSLLLVGMEELGETLVRLLQQPSLRQGLEEQGAERASHFHWDRICSEYEDIYEEARLPVRGVYVKSTQTAL